MARVYSHRNGRTQKKAKPIEAMYASFVSIFSLVVHAVVIGISAFYAGETSKWIGGVGVLGFFVAIGAFAYNVGQMKMDTDVKEKTACMVVSSIVLFIWVATFVIGMVN